MAPPLVAPADMERTAGEEAGQELWDDENEQQGQRWRPGSRRIMHGTKQQRPSCCHDVAERLRHGRQLRRI